MLGHTRLKKVGRKSMSSTALSRLENDFGDGLVEACDPHLSMDVSTVIEPIDGDVAPETAADAQRRAPVEKVPTTARAWGFVRNLRPGEGTPSELPQDLKPSENDVTLWLDEERFRFLVASGQRVIDDLSPLQFVQFVRELRHVTSRILFKYDRQTSGPPQRAFRVWAPH
jgi:hypothetical protein